MTLSHEFLNEAPSYISGDSGKMCAVKPKNLNYHE